MDKESFSTSAPCLKKWMHHHACKIQSYIHDPFMKYSTRTVEKTKLDIN